MAGRGFKPRSADARAWVLSHFQKELVVDWMMTPTPHHDVHGLVPRTCAYGTLHGQRECADVTKLRALRRGAYLGLSGWALL